MNHSDNVVALVCSVPLEANPLAARLESAESSRVGGKFALFARVREQPVVLLVAGMGKANASHALTALLERQMVREVICFGVGGAYPASGLTVGDLALATEEIYGDEGVNTASGWLSTADIGIPLLQRPGECLFNRFPVDEARVAAAEARLRSHGQRAQCGPFVTVSACSGTEAAGQQLSQRFHAICESMEGAAFAHVAAWYNVPFLEVRGISNLVEDRDLSTWNLGAAAEAAALAAWALAHPASRK